MPRSFGLFARRYIHLKEPKWYLESGDTRFECLFKDQQILFEKGTVVWGHIVQANSQLFEPGEKDHPAAAVFSMDPHYDHNLSELANIAYQLYEYKGVQDPPEEMREFAEIITNEMHSPFNVLLPHVLTSGRDVYVTSLTISRKHLPERRLVAGWLPLLVGPSFTKASAVVPGRYWPSKLEKAWSEAE